MLIIQMYLLEQSCCCNDNDNNIDHNDYAAHNDVRIFKTDSTEEEKQEKRLSDLQKLFEILLSI